MSNIYIQEPPTNGKVILTTTVGEIEVELWSKETPKACRNFVQLCMEGYYNGTIFHRVVPQFIVQGGDPTGSGEGGESIYGEPFKNEVHSRLRFARRGLVALANTGNDDNNSQFFFTLGATPELQGKHTIFGKVGGDTIYNMLKLEEGDIDRNERPLHPHKIIKAEILSNPFPDIVPREQPEKKAKREKKEDRRAGVKNFKLISFGDEAEEDEEETREISQALGKKKKSAHDLLNDPKLSREASSIVPYGEEDSGDEIKNEDEEKGDDEETKVEQLKLIRDKLKSKKNEIEEKKKLVKFSSGSSKKTEEKEDDEEIRYYLGMDREKELLEKKKQIQEEIRQLKKDYQKGKIERLGLNKNEEKDEQEPSLEDEDNEFLKEYKTNLIQFGKMKQTVPLKSGRQEFTMKLLEKFNNKLQSAPEETSSNAAAEDDSDNPDDSNWMGHTLKFTDPIPKLARDANTKDDDWFEITDPRHRLNKRRREESQKNLKKHLKKTFDDYAH